MAYRVGVDIGGSFTDFCAFDDEAGKLLTLKVLSTPDNPGNEVLNGIRELQRRFNVEPSSISYFTHGTTVGINSVIQRKGIRQALFVTEGFRDVLELARLKMPDPYDLFSRRPEPLISRDRVFAIRERMTSEGEVDVPVDEASVAKAIAQARSTACEGIVISFLHAYRNPAHEHHVRDLVKKLAPDLFVSCASDVWPAVREYERTSTAVVAGYVQPRISHYLASLQQALSEIGVLPDAFITTSNGGVMQAELGKTQCAKMLLSGTASGAIGAAYFARMCGLHNILSFDAGGTSVDVAMIIDGKSQHGTGEMIGEFPIYIPTVSVTSVGEGGGSIAWVDSQGVLKVGPESAGSSPGPACYGRGGTRPTITDAFAVCGFIGQSELGYNAISVDVGRSLDAVGKLGDQLCLRVEQAAEAIIEVATSGSFAEISKLFSRYGADPEDFSLLAFGGAGPMLACFMAQELGMKQVVVPLTPGVLSAFGGLVADVKNEFIKTRYQVLTQNVVADMAEDFLDLRRQAMNWLRNDQAYSGDCIFMPAADMRYEGQSYEIDVPLDVGWVERGDWSKILNAFFDRHDEVYGYADPDAVVQLINLKLTVVGPTPKPVLVPSEPSKGVPVPKGTGRVFLRGEWRDADLYDRDELRPGHRFAGPAIVVQSDTTTCIPDYFETEVDRFGNLLIRRAM
ncbi:hydantoinase/oxoprolinase family protein [Mesorhizobium sp.]|uniref:hydantoinase/oxoprolinase family protein n=1 Tax=Mesorhizobium sp. TaxID=1871066 RepID=UPI000FE74358|nr:hydantoinase/oxoprolinase family protein [Mesorhizobium sp.]RWJ05731.1 MAG: hydantoinase/oxoprolinase family protein [Mesorhizobium sp.]